MAAPLDHACHKSWLDPLGNLVLEKQTATEARGFRVTLRFTFALVRLKNPSEEIVKSMLPVSSKTCRPAQVQPYFMPERCPIWGVNLHYRGLTGQSDPESS